MAWHDAEEVLEMETDAALKGDPFAQRRLGYRRLIGRGLQHDPEAAYNDFQAAARAGDAYALFNLGYMYTQVGLSTINCILQVVCCPMTGSSSTIDQQRAKKVNVYTCTGTYCQSVIQLPCPTME